MNTQSNSKIAAITLHNVRVSARTNWLLLQLMDSDGVVGVGEATLQNREPAVVEQLEQIVPALLGHAAEPRSSIGVDLSSSLARAAAVSAIDHALWDVAARREHRCLAHMLGAEIRPVALYANVNRGLASRTPAAFAAAAHDALAAGFGAVKIAPFDEIDMHGRWGAVQEPGVTALAAAIARVAAVREAIGPDRDLLVDCHWRFDEAWARRAIDALAELRLYWIECPIPESATSLEALTRLRTLANRHDMRLAGGEDGIGSDWYLPYFDVGAYDVVMPDIKYVGGIAEMRAVANLAARYQVELAPHNPSGPVAHAASLQLCTGLAAFSRLELQFNESPLFDTLVVPALPASVGGRADLPTGPGLGIALSPQVLAANSAGLHHWGARVGVG